MGALPTDSAQFLNRPLWVNHRWRRVRRLVPGLSATSQSNVDTACASLWGWSCGGKRPRCGQRVLVSREMTAAAPLVNTPVIPTHTPCMCHSCWAGQMATSRSRSWSNWLGRKGAGMHGARLSATWTHIDTLCTGTRSQARCQSMQTSHSSMGTATPTQATGACCGCKAVQDGAGLRCMP